MTLDIFNYFGNCAKKGRIIEATFNDANYKMDLNYDVKSDIINATTITNFEKYEYTTEVYEYEDSDEIECFTVAYIKFCLNLLKCRNKKVISNEKSFYDKKQYNNFIEY